MRRIVDTALGGIMALSLFGCGAHQVGSAHEPQVARETTTRFDNSQECIATLPQTGYSEAVPTGYLQPSSRPGAVERLDYSSLDYAGGGDAIDKVAYVYTPYGYDAGDANARYDVVYLMHGWGGHAGEYFEMAGIKDLLDNMIERGDIAPTIFVSATFYRCARRWLAGNRTARRPVVRGLPSKAGIRLPSDPIARSTRPSSMLHCLHRA